MSEFTDSVDHYCEGLHVAVGCHGVECEYADGDEEHICEPSFSWSQCDSCGTRLGGDREVAYGFLILLPKKRPFLSELIKLSICADCVLYHANGDEPDDWSQGV